MTIHKEGRTFLIVLLAILAVFNSMLYISGWVSSTTLIFIVVVSVVLFLLVLQFFRHPHIFVQQDEKYILAPADGKVVVVENTTENEFLQEERVQISIFMSPLNVHVNRNPVSGVVKYFRYHPGKYLVAWHPKSSIENERTTVVYETASGLLLPIRQIAGAMARRIKYYIGEGDRVQQGDEFGFIKFGSRVDVFVPVSAEVKVSPGMKTKAGVTILAVIS
jgi:phosphatidylserine decarboxylase